MMSITLFPPGLRKCYGEIFNDLPLVWIGGYEETCDHARWWRPSVAGRTGHEQQTVRRRLSPPAGEQSAGWRAIGGRRESSRH